MTTQLKQSLVLLLLLAFLPLSLAGQERTLGPTPQQIRVRKLAELWRGKQVIMVIDTGEDIVGRPIKASFYNLTMEVNGTQIILPIDTLSAVILRPGAPEVLLSAVAGILGGALGYGATQLAVPTASATDAQTVAAITGIGATWWGFRAFYREIRYDLKGEDK